MAILMGLISAICWGATDFVAGRIARQIGVTRSLFYSQSLGLLFLSVWFLFHPSLLRLGTKGFGLSMAVLAAVCNLLAMISLLKALSLGKASIVAPITSLYGAVTVALSVLGGRSIATGTVVSLVLCVLGASLAGISKSSNGKPEVPASIILALLAAVIFGVGFWIQGAFAVEELGVAGTLWVYYLVAVVFLFAALAWNRTLAVPPVSMSVRIGAVGVLSFCGFAAFAYGSSTDQVAVVTVLSSLASAVTALLGFAFLAERPSFSQWIGITIITVGVVSLKLGI